MPANPQQLADFEWYIANQGELVKQYNGKVLAIKNKTILAAYDSEMDALIETEKTHEPGTFIIQKCTPGDEAYTATFHSRVVFA